MKDWLKTISIPLGLSFCIIFIFSRFIKALDSCIETEEELLKKEKTLRKELKEKEKEKKEEKEAKPKKKKKKEEEEDQEEGKEETPDSAKNSVLRKRN